MSPFRVYVQNAVITVLARGRKDAIYKALRARAARWTGVDPAEYVSKLNNAIFFPGPGTATMEEVAISIGNDNVVELHCKRYS